MKTNRKLKSVIVSWADIRFILDFYFENSINYYRLRQYDLDGTEKKHYKTVVIDNSITSNVELIRIYNLLGQPVSFEDKGLQIHVFSDGTSKKVFNQ